jgi:uncharacterized protein YbbC (DUF1343 family)
MRTLFAVVLVSLWTPSVTPQVSTGIDVLEQQKFAALKEIASRHGGQLRLAVLTNQVGIDAHERRTLDVLRKDAAAAIPGLALVRLFSAEHGINGTMDKENVGDSTDPESGLPIVSLYGSTDAKRRPTAQQLAGLDAVVIDLQDVGVRYWTYTSLVGYFLEAAAANKIDIVILDRPNPVGGVAVQGPLISEGRENHMSYYAEPVRPGMTMGELASLFNAEKHLRAQLTVVKMTGWQRAEWFDETGLLWVNPSPNLRSFAQEIVYPGIGLIESSNLSVGRGTESPFLRVGAPWIHAAELTAFLNARKIPGVSFVPVFFTPAGEEPYPYRGQRCEGAEIVVSDRKSVDAPELGVEVASAVWKLYPVSFQVDKIDRLLLNKHVLEQIKSGKDPRTIAAEWQAQLAVFQSQRTKYLLY